MGSRPICLLQFEIVIVVCMMLIQRVFGSELSEEIWLKPGEAVDLRCEPQFLRGIYIDSVLRWVKDGRSVDTMTNAAHQSNGYLRLTDLQVKDSGLYQCKKELKDGAISTNSVRLHVGASVQEQLLKSGPLLSTANSLGIPNVWVLSFAVSLSAVGIYGCAYLTLRTWYKSHLKKYEDKETGKP